MPEVDKKMRVSRVRLTPRKMEQLVKSLYVSFKLDLVADGLQAGDLLPGEKEMAERYEVPLSVVRRVHAKLRDEGLAEPVRNKGVFLRKSPADDLSFRESKQFLNLAIVAYLDVDNPDAKENRVSGVLRWFDLQSGKNHCRTKLFNTYPGTSVEFELLESLKAYKPDGILHVNSCGDQEENRTNLRKLKMLDIPTVSISDTDSDLCNCLSFDYEQSARMATEHLIRHGHRRIGFVQASGPEAWRRERLQGYRQALTQAGIQPDNERIFDLGLVEPGQDCFREPVGNIFSDLIERCSAVFCSADPIAAEVILAAQRAGLRVPEDLSVMGIDDDFRTRHLDITTVPISGHELGRAGFELLTEIINTRPTEPINRKVPSSLLIRSSVADFSVSGPRAQLNVLAKPANWIAVFSFFLVLCWKFTAARRTYFNKPQLRLRDLLSSADRSLNAK
jgi:DNA-binding LacI/PurR family transcriptional regulator